eukprot:TRINITY_DN16630_c0_g1_i3.p1 TRINITY_DN16630_c0_g1~~TRINITY_DN16630_c0_g1_i3.p1  ORF type:complete len:343 (+),score=66.38 TRINITY_DN16630_c0_g1_i3:67-1095(+)
MAWSRASRSLSALGSSAASITALVSAPVLQRREQDQARSAPGHPPSHHDGQCCRRRSSQALPVAAEDKKKVHVLDHHHTNRTGHRRLHVLVTGFHDWRDLGETPNLWRCRDNPSCRLLLGGPCDAPPVRRDGELPKLLRKELPNVDFSFQTLTTTWETSRSLDLHTFDAVVHLGLGVYDCRDKILVEDGAYNKRDGKDALGKLPASGWMEFLASETCESGRMHAVVQALDGRTLGGYQVEAAPARPGNRYICNETHWRALRALEDAEKLPPATARGDCGGRRLRGCFFVHIPLPDKTEFASEEEKEAFEKHFADLSGDKTNYGPLARGVSEVIKELLKLSTA